MNSTFKPKTIDYISGVFIVFAIFGFIYILYASYTKNVKKEYDTYYTYFDSSHGVTKSALIHYLEIPIGIVNDVELSGDNKVKVTFGIESKFNTLITKDSSIEVLSKLGIGSILNGNGLQLKRSLSKEILPSGSTIASIAPKSISDIIEQFELDKLSVSFKSIVDNIDKLLITLNKKDGDFMSTLNNINKISKQAEESNVPLSLVNLTTNVQKDAKVIIKDLSYSISLLDQIMITSNKKIDTLNINKINEILIEAKKLVKELNTITITSKKMITGNKDKINNIIIRTDNITKSINNLGIFDNKNSKLQSLDIK
ncbi:MAG: MlaD family protein [Campylobacterota bacterium]|nr:MlaD family protein [Campylobacterota bacterium]